MTTQDGARLCSNGHEVAEDQRFCGSCGEEVRHADPAAAATPDVAEASASPTWVAQHKFTVIGSAAVVVLVLIGIVVGIAASGSPEHHHRAHAGVSLEQIINAACDSGTAQNQGAAGSGAAEYYRCDDYTFIRVFNSPAALQAWASGQSCTSGYAVAGPNWIVTGIGDPTRASALVKLGGAMAC